MAYGDGSVYARRDRPGTWVAQLDVGWGGRRQLWRRTVRGTERDAEDELARMRARRARGATASMTVAQYVAWWLELQTQRVADEDLAPGTLQSYRSKLEVHVVPSRLSRVRLGQLTAADVRTWLQDLAGKGVSAVQRGKVLVVLRAALQTAVDWEVLDRNVARNVKAPKTTRPPGTVLPVPDAVTLLRRGRATNVYAVLLGTACRIGEALALSWDDVDFAADQLRIGHTLSRVDGEWRRGPTKNHQQRVIPMVPMVRSALMDEASRQLAAGLEHPWRLAFLSPSGDPTHYRTVYGWLGKDLEELDLPRVKPHDLRRTSNSLMAAMGVPPEVRKAILGHSTVAITQDVYTTAMDPDVASALHKLGERLTDDSPAVHHDLTDEEAIGR